MKISITLGILGAVMAAAVPEPYWKKPAKHAEHMDSFPFSFTSTYEVMATPNQVVDSDNMFTGGLKGALGYFNYGINSHENVICYNITLTGFKGDYTSKALTSTHIHEASAGKSGPPRIAFPNPMGDGPMRNGVGCLKGPFKTGIPSADGGDTGDGFHVIQIEEKPKAFFTDTHSTEAVPGTVRGQLCKKKY